MDMVVPAIQHPHDSLLALHPFITSGHDTLGTFDDELTTDTAIGDSFFSC